MSRRYTLMVVPKAGIRNDGVGDYYELGDGSWNILSADMTDDRHVEAILVHELVETMLIRQAGVPEPVIDAFDAYFEVLRKNGLADGEPGDDPASPYFKQHQVATKIERILIEEGFGLNWQKYLQTTD